MVAVLAVVGALVLGLTGSHNAPPTCLRLVRTFVAGTKVPPSSEACTAGHRLSTFAQYRSCTAQVLAPASVPPPAKEPRSKLSRSGCERLLEPDLAKLRAAVAG